MIVMRQTLHALLLFVTVSAFSQQHIEGVIKDETTQKPLPFVSLSYGSGEKIFSNADGTFTLSTKLASESFLVTYVGYASAKIVLIKSKKFYTVLLKPLPESKVGQPPNYLYKNAVTIIENAIRTKKNNDPEKVLKSFRLRAYSKILVTANKDSIIATPDSIFKKKRGKLILKKLDTTGYFLKNQLQKSHLYLSEKASEIRFLKSKGRQEYINASRMAGFTKPVNELLTLQLQSFSLYANNLSILGTNYKAPLAANATKFYNYTLLDTVNNSKRAAYVIYFSPKKKNRVSGIQGLIHVDKESLAIQKGIIYVSDGVIFNAVQNFQYFKDAGLWFPVNKNIEVKKKPDTDQISLFGNTINLDRKNVSMNDSISLNTHQQKASDYVRLISMEKYSNIEFNPEMNYPGKGIDIVLDDKISERKETFWSNIRPNKITDREKETYFFLDSLSKARKVENKISLIRKLTQGYLGTRYIDFDLRYLIKYNNFEGFKPGVGAVTNNDFSKKVRLSAYGLYGFKDTDFKYGLGAETRLDRFSNTWLGFMFTDDITETGSEGFITDGRAFYVFEPRLFNITLFHKNKTLSPYIQHDILPSLTAKVQVNKSDIAPTFNYQFLNRGRIFRNYKIATFQMALHWAPENTILLSDAGKRTVRRGYPQFTMQFTKGFRDFLDADFNFAKLNFRGIYQINALSGANTSFLLRAGIAWGDLPLTELYHVSPNNPDNIAILRRFSVADSNSFETMFFNEFFSDKYLSFQVRHTLPNFIVTDKFKPQLVLVSRFAIGDTASKDKHLNFEFNTLDQGFYESGIEVNRLFKGFGISTFYRYGPYQLKGFDQNFSFKFTFNFSLGF
jgi:hypothetical protein